MKKINIQFIQKTMVMIVSAILTVLYDGLARLGCGLGGISYEN
jgi:hypothetical protein